MVSWRLGLGFFGQGYLPVMISSHVETAVNSAEAGTDSAGARAAIQDVA